MKLACLKSVVHSRGADKSPDDDTEPRPWEWAVIITGALFLAAADLVRRHCPPRWAWHLPARVGIEQEIVFVLLGRTGSATDARMLS
jgi:hypothetical protein